MARPEAQISGNSPVPGEIRDLNSYFKPEHPRLTGDMPQDSQRSDIETSQRSEAVLDAFFMNTIPAAVILDRDFHIVRTNAVFDQRFAGDAADLKGHTFWKIVPDADRQVLEDAVRTKKTVAGSARPFEFPVHPEWGVTYWDWKLVPVFDAAGAVDLLILSLNDVTEHVEVQAELTELAECFLAIIDYTPNGVLLAKPDGTVLSANQAANLYLKKNPAELRAFIRKETVDRDDPQGRQALPAGTETVRHRTEMLLRRPDGSHFPADVTTYLFRDRHGQLLSGMVIQDKTKWKKKEVDFRLSEEKFSKVFHYNQTPMAISRLKDGVYLDVNNKYAKMFGLKREEMLNQSSVALSLWTNPKKRERLLSRLSANEHVLNTETRYQKRNGATGYTISSFATIDINNEKCLLISAVDITERKKSEAALRVSEEKYSKAFYNNQMLLAIARLEDRVLLEVNDAFLDLSGYSREEIIGQSAVKLFSRGNPFSMQSVGDRLLKEGKLRNIEIKSRKKSGEVADLLYSFNLIEFNGVKCILGSGIDITELKQTRADLLLSEVRFHKTFNLSPQPMMIISADSGAYLEINDAFIKSSGYTREDIIGTKVMVTKNWADVSKCEQFLEKAAAERFVQNFESELFKKSGEIITCLISGAVISWQGEECILGIINDITELKRYESELARLDRLNLIGQMAAGIGHEIRNPMTTVRGFLQLMMKKDRYAPDLEFLELMIAELDRANAIITEFLSLAKTKTLGMEQQSLNQKIRNILPLMQADALKQDKNIELELGDIPHILMSKNEIHQMILNLVYNGLEAMTPGGCLTIKTYQEAAGVTLAVKDQGGLMPPEVLEKLGTPFFTTKDRGTGLGLAVCYNIAQMHNAVLDVENDSAGTTFYVRFKDSAPD